MRARHSLLFRSLFDTHEFTPKLPYIVSIHPRGRKIRPAFASVPAGWPRVRWHDRNAGTLACRGRPTCNAQSAPRTHSPVRANYPQTVKSVDNLQQGSNLRHTVAAMQNPYALSFSMGCFLYVAAEAAIYVWMPTLLADYRGSAATLVTYSISIFFILRAAGRFIGGWMLKRFYWTSVLALFSGLILVCFVGSVAGGAGVAVYLLPASGLFMSVIYPSINSKGIGCFPKSEHGAIAGVILFFTCLSAVIGPLAMGAVSDAMGGAKYGFTGFTALLFLGLFFNWVFDPTREHLNRLEATEY